MLRMLWGNEDRANNNTKTTTKQNAHVIVYSPKHCIALISQAQRAPMVFRLCVCFACIRVLLCTQLCCLKNSHYYVINTHIYFSNGHCIHVELSTRYDKEEKTDTNVCAQYTYIYKSTSNCRQREGSKRVNQTLWPLEIDKNNEKYKRTCACCYKTCLTYLFSFFFKTFTTRTFRISESKL